MKNIIMILLGTVLGITGTFYTGRGGQNQWIKVDTEAGPIYIAVQHIVSVSVSPVPSFKKQTEIRTITEAYYTTTPLDEVIKRMIE